MQLEKGRLGVQKHITMALKSKLRAPICLCPSKNPGFFLIFSLFVQQIQCLYVYGVLSTEGIKMM